MREFRRSAWWCGNCRIKGIHYRDLGREEFIKRVWKWKEESGGTIQRQMKQIGESCDWSREKFTLSPELSRVVREVFVRLYEEGLIYREKRMVNWCPGCRTVLSDLEVIHEERQGHLWYIRYPVAGSKRIVGGGHDAAGDDAGRYGGGGAPGG